MLAYASIRMETASGGGTNPAGARLLFVAPKSVATEYLASAITSQEEFERVTKAFHYFHYPSTPPTVVWACRGFQAAVRSFDAEMQLLHNNPDWSFYIEVMPRIRAWALDYDSLCRALPLLPCLEGSGLTRRTVDINASEIRFLLANCLFCNTATVGDAGERIDFDECGSISIIKLLLPNNQCSVERTKCFLAYFAQEAASPSSSERILQFIRTIYNCPHSESETVGTAVDADTRGAGGGVDFTDWRACSMPVVNDSAPVVVHVGRMEDNPRGNSVKFGTGDPEDGSYPPNAYFVNFANSMLHIGQVIPSATQEEVLFSCCPEAFVGMLLVQRLSAREAMAIRGLQRYCEYSGYLYTFKYGGFFADPPLRRTEMLVVDAIVGTRWREAEILRDLNKAYLSFAMAQERPDGTRFDPDTDVVVSTGHWGCGAFGGNKTLKFLQQVMAATCAGVCLDYSTFSESDTREAFIQLLDRLRRAGCTVGELYSILCGYVERPSSQLRLRFEAWVLEAINDLEKSKTLAK